MTKPKNQTKARGRSAPGSLSGSGWADWADPPATNRLRGVVREGRIGHAYLLSGPRGVGKARLARSFAQALCCTNVGAEDPSVPCGECRSCRNVLRGSHPDVEVFDLESQALLADKSSARGTLSIDTVRRLRSTTALLPLEAKRRIVIIDDAETLLEPAQQALLKTLEEPPPTVTLLLLADESEALLETVRSRCQHVPVRPVAEARIANALEASGVEATVASDIAELSRGCPAWAIEAAVDDRQLRARRSERDLAASWIDASEYERLVTAYSLGEQFAKKRGEVIGIVLAAVQILRARMIEVVSDAAPITAAGETRQPDRAALSMSTAVAASLQCLLDLEANVRPRLALEAMVVQWPN